MALSSSPYDATINAAAARNNQNPDYLRGIFKQESGFDPNAVNSKSGAMGLGQVLPSTAADPGYGLAPLTNPYDPTANINFASDYLAARTRAAGGNLTAGTTAYSGGEYSGVTPLPAAGTTSADGSSVVTQSGGSSMTVSPFTDTTGQGATTGGTSYLGGADVTGPTTPASLGGAPVDASRTTIPAVGSAVSSAASAVGSAVSGVGGAVAGFAAMLPRIAVGMLGLILLTVAFVAFTRES